jgi:hypothetical protein
MRGCEDQAGVAPPRAGDESFLELSLTVATQDCHQWSRDRQHGDRGLRLPFLAEDPSACQAGNTVRSTLPLEQRLNGLFDAANEAVRLSRNEFWADFLQE